MRRVMALWTSVALATLVAGLAVAQDAGTGSTGDPASATGSQTATGTTATGAATTSAATPGAEATAGTVPGGTPEEMDAGTYAVRLRDLEQRIDALKEQIFRSKARLSL